MTKKFAKIKKETNEQTNKKEANLYRFAIQKLERSRHLIASSKTFPLKFPERGIIKPLSVSFLPLTDYNLSSRKKLKRSCLLLEHLLVCLCLCLCRVIASVNRDNISISISITKQQYLMSAEIQAKTVPNPALISCFKLASSPLNTLYYNEKLAEAGRINYLNYLNYLK